MSDDEIIAVVQAHKEGKQIQWVGVYEADKEINWRDCGEPVWNFPVHLYRVKPEPRKPREWMINVLDNGWVNTGAQIPCRLAQDDNCKLVHVREVIE